MLRAPARGEDAPIGVKALSVFVSLAVSLALGVTLALLMPAAQARPLADPIVGFWNFSGGVIQVTGGPTSFTGTVVKATRFSECTHPVGEVIWHITKQGSGYVGTHQYFDDTGSCIPGSGGPGKSTWTIVESGGQLILRQCSTSPKSGNTQCDDLTRAKPVKPPTTKPPKPAPPAAWRKLVLDYEIPHRYGPDENGDHLVDAYTARADIDPRFWTALITVRRPGGAACDPSATYTWKIGGYANTFERVGTCTFAFRRFPHLGDYRLNVRAINGADVSIGEIRVRIKDLLVVGLGDSNGSGEGNPDIPGALGRRPVWVDLRCNRSHYSYQARTAAALEDESKKSSVTFVHLACSGASIVEGMIGSYRGINDPGEDWAAALLPQVTQLGRLVGTRKPDAVIVSIGVNDLNFGKVVKFCLFESPCFAKTGVPGGRPGETLAQAVDRWLAKLPGRYDKLAAAFERAKIPAGRIYITQYFDSLRDEHGKICDPLMYLAVKRTKLSFSAVEADWAYDDFLVPLNGAVAAAAKRHGWHLVSGAQQLFRPHGYCSTDSWIVPVTTSAFQQWSLEGTLHANPVGHEHQARLVVAALERNGISGKPR